MTRLVFIGMGGNILDVVDAVVAANAVRPAYEMLGYLGAECEDAPCGLKRLGDLQDAASMPEDVRFIGFPGVSPGGYARLPEAIAGIGLPSERYAAIVHPRAYVSPQSTVGPGTAILAGTTLGARVAIGRHNLILQNVGLSHDDVISDYCCLAVGVSFSGRVRLETNCYVGTNATVVNGVTVGAGSLIGCGAVVRHDVPPGEVWVGNPARLLRRA